MTQNTTTATEPEVFDVLPPIPIDEFYNPHDGCDRHDLMIQMADAKNALRALLPMLSEGRRKEMLLATMTDMHMMLETLVDFDAAIECRAVQPDWDGVRTPEIEGELYAWGKRTWDDLHD